MNCDYSSLILYSIPIGLITSVLLGQSIHDFNRMSWDRFIELLIKNLMIHLRYEYPLDLVPAESNLIEP